MIAPYECDVMVSDGGDRDVIEDVPRVQLAPRPFLNCLVTSRAGALGRLRLLVRGLATWLWEWMRI